METTGFTGGGCHFTRTIDMTESNKVLEGNEPINFTTNIDEKNKEI